MIAVLAVTGWLCASLGFLAGCWWAGRTINDLRQANCAQQDYIDYLEAGGDVVAEAEDLLQEPGS